MHFGINDTVLEILERLQKENRKSEYVFAYHDEDGNPHKVNTRWIQRWWRNAVEKSEKESGLDFRGLRFYELKHTLGTRMAAAGENQFTIKGVMNHKSLNSTERYVRNNPQANLEALKRLEKEQSGDWSLKGLKERANSEIPPESRNFL